MLTVDYWDGCARNNMRRVGRNVLEVVGNTPLVKVSRFVSPEFPNVYLKLEASNPGGSSKDRSALAIIEGAEREYNLQPGAKLMVATSGNMGIGMAMVCAVKQFQLYCLVDPKISPVTERCLELYGARIIKVYRRDETGGYHLTRLEKVQEIQSRYPEVIYLDQYDSEMNIQAHYRTTAPEIFDALKDSVRAIVIAAGTGGTSMGIARFAKQHSPATDIWLVDEFGSLALPGKKDPCRRFLNGMGTSIAPANYNRPSFANFVDHVIYVRAEEGIRAAVQLARTEGILAGGTGGAVAHVLKHVAALQYATEDNIVGLLPDHGSRYTDTQFNEEWLAVREISVPEFMDFGGEEDIKL